MNKGGCVICNSELVYFEDPVKLNCSICGREYDSNTSCVKGHFICDSCHESEGFDLIQTYCSKSRDTNPFEIADFLMDNPGIKLHGPEHHFLVPAVLITSYYNRIGKPEMIEKKIKIAREKAKNILGGFCGFYGNCGAGVGAGIFLSTVLDCTPLSREEWKLSNLITAECLREIAMSGGPRCCKRDTYITLETTVKFLCEHLDVELNSFPVKCKFYDRNDECRKTDCKYFSGR